MYQPTKWKDEILDTTLSTESAAGTGAQTTFPVTAQPLSIAKVTVDGARVFNWIYNPATHNVIFDAAPPADAAILFYYYAEIQRGTNQSAENFNNSEENGAYDGHIAGALFGLAFYQYMGDLSAEIQTVTLTNTAAYPFNNSAATVSLAGDKSNANYDVEVEVLSHVGPVGGVNISGKLLNGFTIAFDGSGSSVTLKLKIKGGTM